MNFLTRWRENKRTGEAVSLLMRDRKALESLFNIETPWDEEQEVTLSNGQSYKVIRVEVEPCR